MKTWGSKGEGLSRTNTSWSSSMNLVAASIILLVGRIDYEYEKMAFFSKQAR